MASTTPLVSIVIITYNSSKYVLETLESVKNQTWENLELIVSDDCSTDQTVEVCSRWLKENNDRFHHVKLITVAENTGIPANCNRGLRAAQGEWLKTIAADDILLNTCITDNMEFISRYPKASFIASDVQEIDENGEMIREVVVNQGLRYFNEISTPQKQLKAYVRWPAFLNTPTFFIKKKMLMEIDYFDEEFRIYEDMTMVIKVMERNYKLYYMTKPTVAYRVHQNAISRSQKINEIRNKEAQKVFRKYRSPHLRFFNPFDLSVYYEFWLSFKYKGIKGYKGVSVLRKLSPYYLYMKFIGIQSY